jgi:hypothetical protein
MTACLTIPCELLNCQHNTNGFCFAPMNLRGELAGENGITRISEQSQCKFYKEKEDLCPPK